MPLTVNVVKSSLAGLLIASYDKFYLQLASKQSLGDGMLSFSSNLIADAVFSATSTLPQLFRSLGAYAQDVFAALLATVAKPLFSGKMPDLIPHTDSYLMNFLINLGANFFASYLETPLKPLLPSFGSGRIVLG